MLKEKFLSIPNETRQLIWEFCYRFKSSGYECFLVGGSCRDLLLGEVPHDFDFATNCPLPVTQKLFKKVIATGEAHGTLSVLWGNHLFEVTRYRKDIETNGRRAIIAYSDSIEEDQQRRDIRINSIAYDVIDEKVVDSQGGLEDFENRMIRFVGHAKERILEDHLRAIRYIRLITRLQSFGFNFEVSEMDQVVEVFDGHRLSLERIYEEVNKIKLIPNRNKSFCSEHLARLNIFQRYFNCAELARKVIKQVIESESLTPFFYAYRKTHSLRETVVDLKLSKNQKQILKLLTRYKNCDFSKITTVKKLLSQIVPEEIEETAKAFFNIHDIDVQSRFTQIIRRKEPIHITDLAVVGEDVKSRGFCGKELGEVLKHLQDKVWEYPSLNQFDVLIKMIDSYQRQDKT